MATLYNDSDRCNKSLIRCHNYAIILDYSQQRMKTTVINLLAANKAVRGREKYPGLSMPG